MEDDGRVILLCRAGVVTLRVRIGGWHLKKEEDVVSLVEMLRLEVFMSLCTKSPSSVGRSTPLSSMLLHQRHFPSSSAAIDFLSEPYSCQSHSANPLPSQSHSGDSDNQA